MFESKRIIVSIGKNKITACSVALGKTPRIQEIGSYDWTNETLAQVLLAIKKIAKQKIRILLSEDFAYVVSVKVEAEKKEEERKIVLAKAQELIPEDLRKTLWDFKEILFVAKPEEDGQAKIVQVVAVVEAFYENLKKAVQQADIKVEAIEPVSFALARLVETKAEPQLIVRGGQTSYLVACQRGLVLLTESVAGRPTDDQIKEFSQFFQDTFRLELKNRVENLDPRLGLAQKKDIKGQDESVLNLTIEVLQKQPEAKSKMAFSKKRLFYLGGLIGGLILFTVLISFFLSNKAKQKKTTMPNKLLAKPRVTVTAKEKSATVSSQIDFPRYSISILNGSGKAGEATKLKDALEEKGFKVASSGNADRFDYLETIVKTKSQVEKEFILPLDKILESLYTGIKHEELKNREEADIVVIIGNLR